MCRPARSLTPRDPKAEVIATADICPHGMSSSLCEWCGYKARIPHLLATIDALKARAEAAEKALASAPRPLGMACTACGTKEPIRAEAAALEAKADNAQFEKRSDSNGRIEGGEGE